MFPHNNEGRNQLLKDYDQDELLSIVFKINFDIKAIKLNNKYS